MFDFFYVQLIVKKSYCLNLSDGSCQYQVLISDRIFNKKKEYVLIMYIFQNGHKIKIKYTNLNWPKIKSGNLY